MSEISYWWTTDGTGDGPSGGYTQVHLSDVVRALAGASFYEGVIPSLLNECAGTVGGANTFAINTGSAVADGKLYENDASVNVNIPSTSADTRIDRIVLRADWTAQTIRITRIAGTQSSTPSAPAVTQTPGSTYDIMLYQVLVNSSGVVTTEADEREWATAPVDESTIQNNAGTLRVKAAGITTNELAQPSVYAAHIADGEVGTAELATDAVTTIKITADAVTQAKIAAGAVGTTELAQPSVYAVHIADGEVDTAELAADAVTQAKIAAGAVDTTELAADSVDDTKAGDRMPQFYRRQGGSATVWSTYGTTTYTPGAVRMQGGTMRETDTGGNAGTVTVTFPTAFSYAPLVFVTAVKTGENITASIYGITTTSFGIRWTNDYDNVTTDIDFNWLAVGPE